MSVDFSRVSMHIVISRVSTKVINTAYYFQTNSKKKRE